MWGKDDMPEWTAVIGVSIMMFINLFFLGLLLQYVGIIVIIGGEEPVPKNIILYIALGFLGLNYFLFFHSEKYESITKELEKENIKERNKNTILLWLYTILSFLFPIILIIYMRG